MDINQIKSKLQSLNNKGGSTKEKKVNYQWKPPIGKSHIRIVPSKYNKDNPFTELLFYYNIGGKTIISPQNFSEKDPIAEFIKHLRSFNDKDKWILAKKLEAKMRYFAPVVVRGKEEEGVKLWSFGKEMYMQLLNLADNEDVGDYTDVETGRDLTVDTLGPEATKTNYNKSTIIPKMKTSKLVEDPILLKKLLNEQPNPIEQFTKYSFEEIKSALQKHLEPIDSEDDDEDSEVDDKKKGYEELFNESI